MTTSSPPSLPVVIEVIVTPSVDEWYPIASNYVETYWLPTVGPTAWAAARRLALIGHAAGWGEAVSHHTEVLGRMVGVGLGQLSAALGRLDRFGLADWLRIGDVPLFQLRGWWPPLPRRHVDRFSDFLPAPQ